MFFAFWKFIAAVCVPAPKLPLVVPVLSPSAVSRCWSATTSGPLDPSRSTGRPATGNVVVVVPARPLLLVVAVLGLVVVVAALVVSVVPPVVVGVPVGSVLATGSVLTPPAPPL